MTPNSTYEMLINFRNNKTVDEHRCTGICCCGRSKSKATKHPQEFAVFCRVGREESETTKHHVFPMWENGTLRKQVHGKTGHRTG
eukprot:9135763-Ditylum_brightwellii.AAC.2